VRASETGRAARVEVCGQGSGPVGGGDGGDGGDGGGPGFTVSLSLSNATRPRARGPASAASVSFLCA
jgi:hypothetical protein